MFQSNSRRPKAAFLAFAVTVLVGLGCTGTGSGCTTLTSYDAGTHYVGPKNDNAVNIRLSAAGVNYLNNNWQTLVELFAPGRQLTVPFKCPPQNVTIPVVGDLVIADQGGVGCNDENCGQLDGLCDAKDTPANVVVQMTGFSLAPSAPDSLEATVQLAIDTGDIYVDTVSRAHGACLYLSAAKCSIRFNAAASAPNDNRIRATVKFGIDTRFDKLLSFSVTSLSGTQICGASGAPAKPECLDPADLSFDGRNTCGDTYCGMADWDPLKEIVLQMVSAPLQTVLTDTIGTFSCAPCMSNADCPRSTDGNNTQSTCDTTKHVCTVGSGPCVPRFLGVEGRLQLGALLSGFGAPADAQLELSVAAGASASVDQGLNFGTRVGVQPTAVALCVPPQAAPAMVPVTAPNFDAEATPNSGYHVGLGVSSNFLNYAFWSAHQAGAVCLNLTSDTVGLINTGLFKTFLPSLGKLTTRDGKDAPMMVVLRPARAPTVDVGQGTYDPATKKPIKPLIRLNLVDISMDFYALIDDREARLFTITADVALPLSLIFEGCDKVTPALGDLKMLITNIRTSNSEMLAEDPQLLANLIPAVIGLAEPALAKALSGIALPSLGAFKLKVNETKGLGLIAGSENYNHLGIYAQLMPLNAACAVASPTLTASLKSSRMPPAESMRLAPGRELPLPEAVVSVRTTGSAGSPEYAYRIDNGLWTDYLPLTGEDLIVAHPRFLLQGRHVIAVRSRLAEDPHAPSAPKELDFIVDWDPPQITLTANPTADRLEVAARDLVSGDRLQFAYQVGDAAPSEFGAARPISLSAVEAQGGVTVLVRDELGNVGRAIHRSAQVAWHDDTGSGAGAVPDAPGARGCSTAGGLALFALAAWLRRRRSQD